MNLRLKLLIGTLVTLIFLNGVCIIVNIRTEIKTNNDFLRQEMKLMKKDLGEQIANSSKVERTRKIKLEQTLKRVTVMVINKTLSAQGSGVTIKYNNKYYILSAGHLAPNLTDELYLSENGQEICKLEIVKSDYNEGVIDENFRDLLLLKPANPLFIPRIYTEIADYEPITGSEIYVVGSPMGIEDVITDGRIISYSGNFMYHMAFTYFGNSGGGVYDYRGRLIGIVSHMINLKPMLFYSDFMIYGAVRVNFIKEFLANVIE